MRKVGVAPKKSFGFDTAFGKKSFGFVPCMIDKTLIFQSFHLLAVFAAKLGRFFAAVSTQNEVKASRLLFVR